MIERTSSQSISYSARTAPVEKLEMQVENSVLNFNSNEKAMINSNEMKKEKLADVVKGLNEFLQPAHTSLKFELHDKLNEYYVTIVDDRTQKVVKEIPSKKLLDLYAAMTEFLGLVVDKKI